MILLLSTRRLIPNLLWNEFDYILLGLYHLVLLERGIFLPVNAHIADIEVIQDLDLYFLLFSFLVYSELDSFKLFIFVYLGS